MLKVFVGNLYFGATEDDLSEWFSNLGVVGPAKVTILYDKLTERSRGFGFAEFASREDGLRAIDAANGMEMMGRKLVVNEARQMERRDSGERREHSGNRR